MCDDDFSGLLLVSDMAFDAPMLKSAKYMKRLTSGNVGVDIGASLIPGVGTVMSAHDALRNFWNSGQDFKRGRILKGLGNVASGVFNTALAGLDIFSFGLGGRTVAALAGGVGRVAKGLGRAGTAARMARVAGAAKKFDARVAGGVGRFLAGDVGRQLGHAHNSVNTLRSMTNSDKAIRELSKATHGMGVGGWVARHPAWTSFGLGTAGGFTESDDPGATTPEYYKYRAAATPAVAGAAGYAAYGRPNRPYFSPPQNGYATYR